MSDKTCGTCARFIETGIFCYNDVESLSADGICRGKFGSNHPCMSTDRASSNDSNCDYQALPDSVEKLAQDLLEAFSAVRYAGGNLQVDKVNADYSKFVRRMRALGLYKGMW